MSAVIIDGHALARKSKARTTLRASTWTNRHGRKPGLAVVLVGHDPASEVYVRSKRRAAVEVGLEDIHHHLPEDADQAMVASVIDSLAFDPKVSGILLQLPLPPHLNADQLIERIPAAKDVDGLTALNQGLLVTGRDGLRPCTPLGVLEMLDGAGIEIAGAEAVVVGRSQLVGRPIAQLLLQRDATVTVAHSKTPDLSAVTSRADILICAAGIPGLITSNHVKSGAAVIDVGIHRTNAGLVGDVSSSDIMGKAGWISPVPGGVGPMTIAMLLANTIAAAEASTAIN